MIKRVNEDSRSGSYRFVFDAVRGELRDIRRATAQIANIVNESFGENVWESTVVELADEIIRAATQIKADVEGM